MAISTKTIHTTSIPRQKNIFPVLRVRDEFAVLFISKFVGIPLSGVPDDQIGKRSSDFVPYDSAYWAKGSVTITSKD